MLAPKPISPARELRLKESVPQLMKALPPIPGDVVDSGSPAPTDGLQDDFETPTRYSPVNLSVLSSSRPSPKNEPMTMDLEEHLEQIDIEAQGQQKTPKFKVKMKYPTSGSSCTGESRPWNKVQVLSLDGRHAYTSSCRHSRDSPSCSRPGRSRLKLKISRHTLDTDQDMSEGCGTVKKLPGAEKVHSPSGRSPSGSTRTCSRRQLEWVRFSHRRYTSSPWGRGEENSEAASVASSSNFVPTPKASRTFFKDVPHAKSLESHLDVGRFPSISTSLTPSERGTLLSGRSEPKKRKGLKTRLSNLRRQPSGSPLPALNKTVPAGDAKNENSEIITTAVAVTPTQASADTSACAMTAKGRPESEALRLARGSRWRRKISKWVHGARKVVSACVRKRRGPTYARADG